MNAYEVVITIRRRSGSVLCDDERRAADRNIRGLQPFMGMVLPRLFTGLGQKIAGYSDPHVTVDESSVSGTVHVSVS